MKLHSKIRQRCELLFIASIVVLSGCGGGEDSTGMLYSEKEITVDGGSISIIDEHNNTIEVIFFYHMLKILYIIRANLMT